MNVTDMVTVIMQQIRETARAETVIGAAVQSGDSVIIPVSRVSFGFGIGGGDRESSKKRSGIGTGVGARIEPVAFVVVTGGKAQLLPLKSREATLSRLIDLIPNILDLIQNIAARKLRKGNHTPAPAVPEGLKG